MDNGVPESPVESRAGSIKALLFSMASLLASYGLLMAGTGLFGTFIVLRAGIEGFSEHVIGFLVAGHYAGMIFGTVLCGPLVASSE